MLLVGVVVEEQVVLHHILESEVLLHQQVQVVVLEVVPHKVVFLIMAHGDIIEDTHQYSCFARQLKFFN